MSKAEQNRQIQSTPKHCKQSSNRRFHLKAVSDVDFAMMDLETSERQVINDISQHIMRLYVSISCMCYTISPVVHQYAVTLKAASEKI